MKFPWSEAKDPMALQPGVYAVEISAAEEKTSQSGNLMWALTLKSLAFNCKLCHDNMMLVGGGLNISKAKLKALGFSETDDVESGHLLGKRCWVTVKEEPYTDRNGEQRTALRVDISAKGSRCGYWDQKPGAVVEPVVAPDSEIPF